MAIDRMTQHHAHRGTARFGRATSAAAVVMALALALLAGCNAQSAPASAESNMQTVVIGGRTFHLELALDDEARYTGLGGRESIPPDGGMLFVFPYPRQTDFVMRDCLVPIDIIFLGPRGEILAMYEMQVEPPESRSFPSRYYSSNGYTQFVIELAGGTLEQLNLKRGQRIELPFDELKARAQ